MATSVCTAASVKTKPIWGHENTANIFVSQCILMPCIASSAWAKTVGLQYSEINKRSAAVYWIEELVCEETCN